MERVWRFTIKGFILKVYTVFEVSCDGGYIGEMYKCQVCSSMEKAKEIVEIWSKPIVWGDGRLEQYVEDTIQGIRGLVCWRPRLLLYIKESELV